MAGFSRFLSVQQNDEQFCVFITGDSTNKLCAWRTPQYAPAPCKLTFDLSTLEVVSESRVTWATSVPILVFLGLSVLDLGLMYTTDRRQTDVRHASSLNDRVNSASAPTGRRHKNECIAGNATAQQCVNGDSSNQAVGSNFDLLHNRNPWIDVENIVPVGLSTRRPPYQIWWKSIKKKMNVITYSKLVNYWSFVA